MRMVAYLQLFGLVFTATAPVIFASPQLPHLKSVVRRTEFEAGWQRLIVKRKLNQQDRGFEEVLRFLLEHSSEEGIFADRVADDLDIERSEVFPRTDDPAVEEIRILTRPTHFSESILICYDESTGGPAEDPPTTERLGLKLLPTADADEDAEWRWFGPLTGAEHNATRFINERIENTMIYGAICLGIGVSIQAISVFLV